MVRTKADASGSRVAAGKAPRKMPAGTGAFRTGGSNTSKAGPSAKDRYSGGNLYNPQPVPNWQKGITSFFYNTNESTSEEQQKTKSKDSSSKNEEEFETNSSTDKQEEMETSVSSTDKENTRPSSELKNNGVISDEDLF